MDRNRRERTFPATNNQIFHRPSATSSPCEPIVPLPAGKIHFARDRSVVLAAAQIECSGCRFSLFARVDWYGTEYRRFPTCARNCSVTTLWQSQGQPRRLPAGAVPGDSRLGVGPLREVDQLRQVVHFMGIDRNVSGFRAIETTSGESSLVVVGEPRWWRPSSV